MKLVEHIKAVETGNRRYIEEPLHSIKLTVDPSEQYTPRFATEYSIRVVLGANHWIADDLIRDSRGQVVDQAIAQMKRDLVEHVYGELRRDLLELHRELRNEINYYDSSSIKKLVSIVEKISL